MKYVVIVGDGMADYPLKELNGLTPLEKARKPNLDFLAKSGINGLVKTIPPGLTPSSDVANLSILGYAPNKFYTGRGPLEALNYDINISEKDIVFRCNFVTVKDERLIDYSAGHIDTKKAKYLIKKLNQKLSSKFVEFYPGVSYRNLMVIKNQTPVSIKQLLKVKCFPPHDVMDHQLNEILPKGKGVEILCQLMDDSRKILKGQTANMIWLWGQGKKPEMPSFFKKYHLKGAVISAVDIVKGIGRAIGLEVINVPGATGYYDTNYENKARYALQSLKKNDFVFVHIEAPDEAGHNGDIREKIRAIENIDKKIVGPIIEGIKKYNEYKILVLSDHPTPISLRTHTADPVPFVIKKIGTAPIFSKMGAVPIFSERNAKKTGLFFRQGDKLMQFFLKM